MAEHVLGPLYYERMGRKGPIMAFVHPNPLDQSCWALQMAHFSTWYRCVAMDIPGYGRSPKSTPGLTMADMAQACWEAVDDAFPGGEKAILVGCSVGSNIISYMYHLRPARTAALVISGYGHSPDKAHAKRRFDQYTAHGILYRWRFFFDNVSPIFRTNPLAHHFAELFMERNGTADLASILYQFEAAQKPDAEGHYQRIACPTLILTGTEDSAHQGAFALKGLIPSSELRILPGAGHACHLEQPWLFDRYTIEFLAQHALFPAPPPQR